MAAAAILLFMLSFHYVLIVAVGLISVLMLIVVTVAVVFSTQRTLFYRYLSARTRRVYVTSSCQSWLVKFGESFHVSTWEG